MFVGFTGTREKLTDAQAIALREWLVAHPPAAFVHGACVGADATAALQVKALYGRRVDVIARPGHLPHLTSQPALDVSNVRHEPMNTLSRNRAIVEGCDVLLACPKGPEEQRSGTWSTIRFARKRGKRIVIIWPDGRVEDSREIEK